MVTWSNDPFWNKFKRTWTIFSVLISSFICKVRIASPKLDDNHCSLVHAVWTKSPSFSNWNQRINRPSKSFASFAPTKSIVCGLSSWSAQTNAKNWSNNSLEWNELIIPMFDGDKRRSYLVWFSSKRKKSKRLDGISLNTWFLNTNVWIECERRWKIYGIGSSNIIPLSIS